MEELYLAFLLPTDHWDIPLKNCKTSKLLSPPPFPPPPDLSPTLALSTSPQPSSLQIFQVKKWGLWPRNKYSKGPIIRYRNWRDAGKGGGGNVLFGQSFKTLPPTSLILKISKSAGDCWIFCFANFIKQINNISSIITMRSPQDKVEADVQNEDKLGWVTDPATYKKQMLRKDNIALLGWCR